MMKFIEKVANAKLLIGAGLSLVAACAWGLDYIHRPFLLKSDLMTIFNTRDINRHEVNIAKLEIRRGLAANKLKTNEYDMLISIEKLQILKLKGKNYGSN